MARRRVGAISTGEILLLGGGGLLLFMMMNKGTTAASPTIIQTTSPATAAIQAQASEQNTIVNDASSNISNIINSIWS